MNAPGSWQSKMLATTDESGSKIARNSVSSDFLSMFLDSIYIFHCRLPGVMRPNKNNKCVSGHGSENFRVGTKFFFNYFFLSGKNTILCILKGILPFKMHKIIFFPENLTKKI